MSSLNGSFSRSIEGHSAVRQALRDTETYSSDLQGDADVRSYRQLPLEVDPPRHHLYRSALSSLFVKPAIEKFAPDFRKISENGITDFFDNPGEVIGNLALPIVMKNLGIIYNRPQDVEEWISWGPDVWTAGGSTRSGLVLHQYLDNVYEEAISHKREDIWSQIAHLTIDGKQIDDEEFRGIAGVLLAGGRDTVVKLFTGIIWYLGNHPETLAYLREDPNRINPAIQEFLRFLTPLPSMARTTTPESKSKTLPHDRYVKIDFVSANFDETVFENPFELDVTRERNSHLSFGFGPHTCLGNHVAEIEAKVFLNALLASGKNWKVLSKSQIRFYENPLDSVPAHFESLYLQIL